MLANLRRLALVAALVPYTSAWLIGMGKTVYTPSCAYACQAVIDSAKISCPGATAAAQYGSHYKLNSDYRHQSKLIIPACRATSTDFLTTLAYCIHAACENRNIEMWKLEEYWAEESTGNCDVKPKWTYGQSLENATASNKIAAPMTYNRTTGEMAGTMVVTVDDWNGQRLALETFAEQETLNQRYA